LKDNPQIALAIETKIREASNLADIPVSGGGDEDEDDGELAAFE